MSIIILAIGEAFIFFNIWVTRVSYFSPTTLASGAARVSVILKKNINIMKNLYFQER